MPLNIDPFKVYDPQKNGHGEDDHKLNIEFQIKDPAFKGQEEILRSIQQGLAEIRKSLQNLPAPIVEAPIVEAPVVNVEPPELDELYESLRILSEAEGPSADEIGTAVAKAVSKVKVVQAPSEDKTLVKTLKNIQEALEKIDFRMKAPGGGGGGPSVDLLAKATDVRAEFASKITVVGPVTYVAQATPGTTQATAAWQVKRIDESVAGTTIVTWADSNAQFDNVATDLTALSYS